MRRSLRTNTLVLINNHTKAVYPDRWIDGVLHYVGMGLTGDQDINHAENITLCRSQTNGVKVHLFEVFIVGQYKYRGEVKIVDRTISKVGSRYRRNNRFVGSYN